MKNLHISGKCFQFGGMFFMFIIYNLISAGSSQWKEVFQVCSSKCNPLTLFVWEN